MQTDEKLAHLTEGLKVLSAFIMNQTNNYKFPKSQKDTLNPQDPTTVVPDNRRAPPLDRGKSNKIGGMWNPKHEISSPKLYELLIKT